MPRLVPITDLDSPALAGLHRSVWQLVALGIVAAAILLRIAPQHHAVTAWSALIPLIALATLHRRALLEAFVPRNAVVMPAKTRSRSLRSQPQARRAAIGRVSTKPLQATRHAAR